MSKPLKEPLFRPVPKVCASCKSHYMGEANQRRCNPCRYAPCPQCGQPKPNIYARFCGASCAKYWWVAHETAEAKAARLQALSRALKGKPRLSTRGANNPNWKGGKKDRRDDMSKVEYKVWRETVFKRDGHHCILCDSGRGTIQAHHIVRWFDDPTLRYAVSNGVTLCRKCHESLSQREHEFVAHFQQYVRQQKPVQLTLWEAASLQPFETTCAQCGTALSLHAHRRKNNLSFCNLACKTAYAERHGYDWYSATGQSRAILRQCLVCSKDIRTTPGKDRRYCSSRCQHIDTSSQVSIECANCSTPFSVKASRAERTRCCSKACLSSYRSTQMTGKVSPRFGANPTPWNKQENYVNCAHCGKNYRLRVAAVKQANYCSRQCQNASGQAVKTCCTCQKEYVIKASHAANSRYCSMACCRSRVSLTCQHCQSTFEIKTCKKDTARYCSRQCYAKARAKQMNGRPWGSSYKPTSPASA